MSAIVFAPVGRMVDDLFRISWELGIIVMLGLIDVGKTA